MNITAGRVEVPGFAFRTGTGGCPLDMAFPVPVASVFVADL